RGPHSLAICLTQTLDTLTSAAHLTLDYITRVSHRSIAHDSCVRTHAIRRVCAASSVGSKLTRHALVPKAYSALVFAHVRPRAVLVTFTLHAPRLHQQHSVRSVCSAGRATQTPRFVSLAPFLRRRRAHDRLLLTARPFARRRRGRVARFTYPTAPRAPGVARRYGRRRRTVTRRQENL